ncbi:MAG: dirigent protein [Solirubrobacteraceae bacterium]
MPQPLANIRLSATIAAATAALALTPLIAAAPASARTAHAAGKTVHVVEHAVTDTEVPGVGGSDVKGNILTFNNPVFDAGDRKQVGHDEGFCVRLQVKLGIWECLWTTFLKGGQITVQGPFYDTRNSQLSITGGTGAYEGARGQMDLKSLNGGKKYDFIFHLK